ncbi:MAG: hypothetical protein FVQ77_06715 [Cytophagales bacterium]|nr:hypothetical protein [Cytophagales bacterium]
MKTIVIQSANDEDSSFLLKFARKMKMKARFIDEEELEDRWLAKLIDEGMKEEGEIPVEKVLDKLRK